MKQLTVLIITACIVMSIYTENGYKRESENNIGSFISIEKETPPKNEETRIDKIRIFLEKNKVFFEIFSSVLLGVMSIIISVVGTQINNKTKKIYKKQLKILEDDREPYFVLKCKEAFTSEKKKYILKNTGGRISCVDFDIDLYFEIIVWDDSFLQHYRFNVNVRTHSKLFYPKKKLKYYDAKNKKFIFYELNANKITNIKKYIEDKIKKNFSINIMENPDVKVYDTRYIRISYVNYKNEHHTHRYEIRDDGITIILQNKNYTYLGTIYIHDIDDDIDDDYIDDYIKDNIEAIIEKIQKEIESKRETSE